MSFRTRILLLILSVALVPLTVMGFWLTRSGMRSGEALLRARLNESLDAAVALLGVRWLGLRSELLDVWSAPQNATALDSRVLRVSLRDSLDREFATWERTGGRTDASGAPLLVRIDVHDRLTGRHSGSVHAEVDIASVLAPVMRPHTGGVFSVTDPERGASLLPLPFDAASLDSAQFDFGGERWVAEQRSLTEPAVRLTAAAPLAPFSDPFRSAAQRGFLLVAVTSVTGFLIALVLTRRLTGSLQYLASLADRVARGDLAVRPPAHGPDEVTRVSRAFSLMTERLHQMMEERAHRESLAALGAFASQLAHEVRNPLTAMRLDLQLVHEQLSPASNERAVQEGVIEAVDRLDRTVTSVLRLARSGRVERRQIDLRRVLDAAAHAVRPVVAQRGGTLEIRAAGTPIDLYADPDALHQLLVNLLLNAAQASLPGGGVWLTAERDGEGVRIVVEDEGEGMDENQQRRALDPFSTSRPGGSGLGLPIAERIAAAHGGRLSIDSTPGGGTTVRVWLPDAAGQSA